MTNKIENQIQGIGLDLFCRDKRYKVTEMIIKLGIHVLRYSLCKNCRNDSYWNDHKIDVEIPIGEKPPKKSNMKQLETSINNLKQKREELYKIIEFHHNIKSSNSDGKIDDIKLLVSDAVMMTQIDNFLVNDYEEYVKLLRKKIPKTTNQS